MDVLRVVTLNVAGIRRNALKMQQVLNEVKNIDLVSLQETHFQNDNELRGFENMFRPYFRVYSSVITENCRGMCILISHRQLGDGYRKVFEIPGRALAVRYKVQETTFLIVAVYAPANAAQRPNFYRELNEKIGQSHVNTDVVVCLGDFNFVENPSLDRSNVVQHTREPGNSEFQGTRELLGIKDVYREVNPSGKQFSHYAKQFKTQSRLDRIYANQAFIDCAKGTSFHTVPFSDHKTVSASFCTEPFCERRGSSYWKLNVTLLQKEEVREAILDHLANSNLATTTGEIFQKKLGKI